MSGTASSDSASSEKGMGAGLETGQSAAATRPHMRELLVDPAQESFTEGTVAMHRRVINSEHSQHAVMFKIINWRVRSFFSMWCEVRPSPAHLSEDA